MDDKNLSGEEKRRKLKEQFKQDLIQRKAFLDKVNRLRGQSRITQALNNMQPNDDTDSWIEKLNTETDLNNYITKAKELNYVWAK